MNNLELYERVRAVPDTAKKKIEAGRLKGKTDINPMWRIKTLTEQFGPCGIGWYTENVRKWTESGANGEIAVFMDINLYVKLNGEWSKPIFGTGGSMLVTNEKNGPYTDDECYKKAYTDALSVACKALGIAADVYFEKDSTKYDTPSGSASAGSKPPHGQSTAQSSTKTKWAQVNDLIKDTEIELSHVQDWIIRKFGANIKINDLSDEMFAILMKALKKSLGALDE